MWSFVFGAYLAVLLYFPVDYSWLGGVGALARCFEGDRVGGAAALY